MIFLVAQKYSFSPLHVFTVFRGENPPQPSKNIPFRRYFNSFRRYFNSFSPLQFLSAVITAFLQSRFGPKIPFRISDLAQKVVTICLCDEGT